MAENGKGWSHEGPERGWHQEEKPRPGNRAHSLQSRDTPSTGVRAPGCSHGRAVVWVEEDVDKVIS